MLIKIDNMIDLRAFCLEQAVKMIAAKAGTVYSVGELARAYVDFVLGGSKLPDNPIESSKLLNDTMMEITKHKEENNL